MTNIYLSLGSNIGNRQKNIEKALISLQNNNIKKLEVSSLYETSPVGPKQRNFYNLVGKFKTNLSAQNLLAIVKDIEKDLGRTKTFRWGPRIIDIDILFYSNKVFNLKKLTIPHKEIQNRLFILCPMIEISPNFVHPIYRKTIKTLHDIYKSSNYLNK